MVVRTNRGLIHPGDHRGAKCGTNRGSRIGLSESDPFAREAINVRGVNSFLALIGKMAGHIVHHDPNDIRSRR